MSRAFVRDSDDHPEPPIARQTPDLPPGTRNYLTAAGAQRLREELQNLVEVVRPPLVAKTDDPDVKRRLLVANQRIEALEESLQSSEILAPGDGPADAVRFGATVTVRDGSGEESTYRIVGPDEIDLDRHWISWMSPIARALLNARQGDQVPFVFPSGEDVLTILDVRFDEFA